MDYLKRYVKEQVVETAQLLQGRTPKSIETTRVTNAVAQMAADFIDEQLINRFNA